MAGSPAVFFLRQLDGCEGAPCLPVRCIEGQDPIERTYGPFGRPQLEVTETQKEVGRHQIRSLPHHPFELRSCERVITRRVVGQTQVDARLHKIRPELEDSLEFSNCVAEAASLHVLLAGAKMLEDLLRRFRRGALPKGRPEARKHKQSGQQPGGQKPSLKSHAMIHTTNIFSCASTRLCKRKAALRTAATKADIACSRLCGGRSTTA